MERERGRNILIKKINKTDNARENVCENVNGVGECV